MKYLTPELLARSRSEDEPTAEAAAAEWERACADYNGHIAAIRPKLPRGARTLLNRLYLHDARVLTLAVDEVPGFSIFLQLDPRPHDWVELKYTLAAKPRLLRHPSLEGDGEPLQWWLYDEIELLEERPLPLFQHAVLLTGGMELQLAFHKLSCRRMRPVLLPGANVLTGEVAGDLEVLPT